MLDSSITKVIALHWRSVVLASASVMLSACVSKDVNSSSSVLASSMPAVSSSSETPSSQAPVSSSVAQSSSSIAIVSSSSVQSSSLAPSSSSVAVSSSSEACVVPEPDLTQFNRGKTAFEASQCRQCHGDVQNNGKTSGARAIDVANVASISAIVANGMSQYLSQDCKSSNSNTMACAADIEHYLLRATGVVADPVPSCEASSSSVASSTGGDTGNSLLNSSGTFASGKESFSDVFDASANATASFNGEANFTINSTTAQAWHIQLIHPLSVVAGEQYTICFDAKAASNRSISVGVDDAGPTYASVAGGDEDISLTTDYQSFSKTFFADATDSTSRLVFNLGLNSANVQLDNIGVYAGDSCDGSGNSNSSSSAAPVSSSSQGTTSSASNPNTGDFIINDDFESGSNGQVPAGWKTFIQYSVDSQSNTTSNSTYALIDSTKAHSGTKSVRIKTGGMAIQPTFIFKDLPSGKSAFYSRFWMNIPVTLGGGVKGGDGNHTHFMAYSTEMSGSNKQELRFGTLQDSILGAFLPQGIDAGTENIVPKVAIPANQWVCLEFAMVKNSMFDQVYAWIDGEKLFEALSVSAWARDPGKFFSETTDASKIDNHVSFGWRSFGDNKGVENVWFDDIVVSSTGRIGCN